MKIYFIGQKGIPARQGGVEKHVEELASQLVKNGDEVFVYTRPNYTDKNLKKYRGVNLISLPSIPTKHLDAISHTLFACFHVWRQNADIIHFQSIGPSFLIWLMRILKPKTPIIATFHCRDYFHKKWHRFARLCLHLGEWIACKMAHKIITVSRELTRYTQKHYKRKGVYIPNGVNAGKKRAPKLIKQWDLKEKNYILAVSRLVGHKGLECLINAYKQLKTDKKLVITGGASHSYAYADYLHNLARENRNIIFAGEQTGACLEELFTNAAIFVQPSENEGLSIALLEALKYGLPTITSDIPANKEVLDNKGLTFKNKNANDLRVKLEFLLKHPLQAQKMSKLGKKIVAEKYDWQNIGAATRKLYDKALFEAYENNSKTYIFKINSKPAN